MPEKPQKLEKTSQGQTLSLRISDALYARLERAKQLMSSKKGDSVSTSEVAKQLLESAREDRFEVADLMAKPTETLLEIRRKGEAQHILSRAEWILLSHFVQKGLEAYTERTPNPVSNESLIAVLDAFLAVYELRTERTSPRDSYYMNNLPSECRPPKAKGAEDSERANSETVRRTVAETRKRLSDPAVKWDTFLAGRNLLILLEDEKLPAADAVNRALRPFFPPLWRLAARGHYCLTQESLRAKSASQDSFYQPPIPSIKEGDFTLSFNRGESNDIYLLLSFPGPRGPNVPGQRVSQDYRVSRHAGRACPGQPDPPLGGRAFPRLCRRVRRRQGEGLLVPRSREWHHVRPLRKGMEVGASVISARVGVAGNTHGLGRADPGVR